MIYGEDEGCSCYLGATVGQHLFINLLEHQNLKSQSLSFLSTDMLIQNSDIPIEEVPWAAEVEVEAELDKDFLFHGLDVGLSHRTLLLPFQVVVSINHILIVWYLWLLQLGSDQQAGTGQKVQVLGADVPVTSHGEVSVHDVDCHEERVDLVGPLEVELDHQVNCEGSLGASNNPRTI